MQKLNLCELPREKLLLEGASALSIKDLITILLETGSKDKDVFLIVDGLLKKHSFEEIANLSTVELIQHKGIGPAKACRLAAAFELGKRLVFPSSKPNPLIKDSEDVIKLVLADFHGLTNEKMMILLLDSRNRLIKKRTLYLGCQNMIPVKQQDILEATVREKSAAFILIHNHPSKDVVPSGADIRMSRRIAKSSKILDVVFADHIIISDDEHFSFREAGLI
ncbi:MAG: DNA repair protein RadC [Nanoarchaeota archaeon]|nr:DNA repair protein RadC [Nanoarchaeota archaeon]